MDKAILYFTCLMSPAGALVLLDIGVFPPVLRRQALQEIEKLLRAYTLVLRLVFGDDRVKAECMNNDLARPVGIADKIKYLAYKTGGFAVTRMHRRAIGQKDYRIRLFVLKSLLERIVSMSVAVRREFFHKCYCRLLGLGVCTGKLSLLPGSYLCGVGDDVELGPGMEGGNELC